MDILSEILESADWKSDLLARDRLYESWGYRFPCDRSGGFHVITQGSCYAKFLGKELFLQKGDLLFITRGIPHDLLSEPNAKIMEIQRFLEGQKQIEKKGKPVTTFVSVRYEVPSRPQHPFFLELPPYILIPSSDIESHHSLQVVISMISKELEQELCSDLILQKLSDIMLYYMIRYWMEKNPSTQPGWLMALSDSLVIRALEALHKNLSYDWTIESLGKSLGVSRANLANRFKELLQIPPMEYLAKVRMEKARNLFQKGDTTLEEVSLAVGYSSAFAFSKAYKRIFGSSPAKEWKKVSMA
ncbi:MAG: AraC family transcriptional regulator [Leptospira sp.]|nr:AraC family transcriptional regulator [Leptospira sp.]